MMLPTDLALIQDDKFLVYVKKYAESQEEFFKDFAEAMGKLIALGCPHHQKEEEPMLDEESAATKTFRELAMHGNLIRMKQIEGSPDPNAPEVLTNRTALHKASFFGHDSVVEYILECGGKVDVADIDGDTPLHDACRLGHTKCVEHLLGKGAKVNVKNKKGETPMSLAKASGSKECVEAINKKGGFMKGLMNLGKKE